MNSLTAWSNLHNYGSLLYQLSFGSVLFFTTKWARPDWMTFLKGWPLLIHRAMLNAETWSTIVEASKRNFDFTILRRGEKSILYIYKVPLSAQSKYQWFPCWHGWPGGESAAGLSQSLRHGLNSMFGHCLMLFHTKLKLRDLSYRLRHLKFFYIWIM